MYNLSYTDDPPTKSDWYWFRIGPDSDWPAMIFFVNCTTGYAVNSFAGGKRLSEMVGQWAGPILEPGELES